MFILSITTMTQLGSYRNRCYIAELTGRVKFSFTSLPPTQLFLTKS